jgi:signal transduction histidine kinase
MGGGLECALACDIRIAERQSQLALPEATVGLLPCAGGTQNLPWLVGEGWAKRMILCDERIDAETALRIGLVEQVVDTQRPHVANKPVTVRVEIEQPLEATAPSSVVSVALSNLIGNAFKYTQAGEVIVTVGHGRVTIEDTGPGINAEDAEKLFERGVRGTTVGKGGGLGLAIVRRLCELYGWKVTLAPRPQGGATAMIEFGRPSNIGY